MSTWACKIRLFDIVFVQRRDLFNCVDPQSARDFSGSVCYRSNLLNSLFSYIAISHPLAYAQSGVVSGGRTWVSLCSVWGLSIAVGLPILLGVNRVDDIQVSFVIRPLIADQYCRNASSPIPTSSSCHRCCPSFCRASQ
jgi:hypothetical protein